MHKLCENRLCFKARKQAMNAVLHSNIKIPLGYMPDYFKCDLCTNWHVKTKPLILTAEQRLNMCYSKIPYTTIKLARLNMKNLIAQQGRDYYMYVCPVCQQYHLTSNKYGVV